MRYRLRRGISERKKPPFPTKRKTAAIKGNAHNVIVVKAPNDIFTEAIFILRDDYYSSSADPTEELLSQAREAAGSYVSGRENSILKICLAYLPAALLAVETALIFMYIV